jgi:asparagine synthetase B (glutamine-hydrolysing)
MAHGLEARVPFLDKAFLELAIKIKPEEKMPQTYQGIEKYILRKHLTHRNNRIYRMKFYGVKKSNFQME